MTSFSAIFKQMTKHKLLQMNRILLSMLAVDITLSVFMIFPNGIQNFWQSVVGVAITVFLIIVGVTAGYICKMMIDETTTNRYRLLPISDGKLYFGSLISSVITYLYASILNLIFLILVGFVSYKSDITFRKSLQELSFSKHLFSETIIPAALMLILLFLIVMLILMLANTLEMSSSIVTDIIPGGRQKVSKVIINLIFLYAIFKLLSLINFNNFINALNSYQGILIHIGEVSLVVVICAIFNAFIMRFVETIK